MRLSLASALTEAGCSVTIVVVNAAGPLAASIPTGVQLVDLQSRRLLCAMPGLRRYLQRECPDFLISSLDHNNIAALLTCATMRIDTRLIICQHNALSEEVRLGWKYRAVPPLYRRLAPKAHAIIAVSEGVADDLAARAGLPRETITVIGNPVIVSAQRRCVAPPIHVWLQDRSVPIFIFAGRLVPQKNPMMLIAAFARYREARHARLVVLGEGPLRGPMMQAAALAGIAQDVHFAGFVAEPQRWIAHAHALLLTSEYEGFANVIVEALACGTPVIATDCPHGPAEILAGGQYGHLVDVGDAQAMALAMTDDLAMRFPPDLLRARASDFTAKAAAAKHLGLFETCRSAPVRRVFGLAFTAKTPRRIAEQMLDENPVRTKLVVTPNIDHVRLLQAQPPFRAACLSADTVCADGWPVALYAALRGAAPGRRATGCDILHALLSHGWIGTRRILAVVENADTAAKVTRWLAARGWSNWTIEVAPPGLSFHLQAQTQLVAAINAARPHLLIMTLGAPTSEIFVHQNDHLLPPCWAICVGQALRVEIGLVTRAPSAWRRLGLEWAWRCIQEPARLGPRYLRALFWFLYAAAADLLHALTRRARALPPLPAPTERHP